MKPEELMKHFNFDESELDINRNGQLSKKQRGRLDKMELNAKKLSLFGSAGNSFMALMGLSVAVWFMATNNSGLDFGTICFGSIFGIFWPLLWGAAGFAGIRRAFTKVEATVKKAEGAVIIEKTIRSSYDSDSHVTTRKNVYELRIGGYTFIVNPVLQNHMKPGDSYAVYFADFNHKERSKEILSVELLKSFGSTSPLKISPTDDLEVIEFVKKGKTLDAIRTYRFLHGTGFEEAKDVVEDIKTRLEY